MLPSSVRLGCFLRVLVGMVSEISEFSGQTPAKAMQTDPNGRLLPGEGFGDLSPRTVRLVSKQDEGAVDGLQRADRRPHVEHRRVVGVAGLLPTVDVDALVAAPRP